MSRSSESLLRAWWRQQHFDPGPLGWLVNPFYFARRGLMRALRALLPELRGAVLDVGCGHKPYRALVPATQYVGLDFDTPVTRAAGVADAFYDGGRFPFSDSSFDGVLCTQVFEHVFNPREFLAEIRRVLRPGGIFVLTVPFVWDEHEQPRDFGRYSSFGLRAALEAAGFEIRRFDKSCADGRALAQLFTGYLQKITATSDKHLNLLIQLAFLAPVSLAGVLLGWMLPANPDLYLDNIVLARRQPDA